MNGEEKLKKRAKLFVRFLKDGCRLYKPCVKSLDGFVRRQYELNTVLAVKGVTVDKILMAASASRFNSPKKYTIEIVEELRNYTSQDKMGDCLTPDDFKGCKNLYDSIIEFDKEQGILK